VLKGYSSSTKLVIKLIIEFLPLGLFFLVTTKYDFVVSTTVFMVATGVSLLVMWYLFRQLALMALITAATGLLAGAVTLGMHDPMYIQMKPTIVSLTFALILLAGLMFGKPLFKLLLGQSLHLTDEGWRVLTWLWFAYFVFVAGLNEYIWRTYTFEFWAAFKAFGLMPLTVIYAVPQMFLLKRYRPVETEEDASYDFGKPDAKKRPLKARAAAESTTP
jgi:intracellular septation protein